MHYIQYSKYYSVWRKSVLKHTEREILLRFHNAFLIGLCRICDRLVCEGSVYLI